MPRIYLERRMGEDFRHLVDLLETDVQGATTGEFIPPVDVTETPDAIQVTADLPGLTREQVQLTFTREGLLIAGFKKPAVCSHADAAFHLAERAFGRFARLIRLAGAFDVGGARATLKHGELRVTLPRITDRRGGEIRIPIETD